ncbi:MAG: hypothetical protein SV375_08230 [Thermodesulfobacteriota bacterium]|nr:hypothetical protein [Thermodesulfobacteriota bacterium]
MKRKNYPLVSLLILTLSALVSILYLQWSVDGATAQVKYKKFVLSPVPVMDMGTMREVRKYNRGLARLYKPYECEEFDSSLTLFRGPSSENVRRDKNLRKIVVTPPRWKYQLTFAFASGEHGFCIIDKNFYSQGALLPDGGQILEIESNGVLVSKEKFKKWIRLSRGEKPEMLTGEKNEKTIW